MQVNYLADYFLKEKLKEYDVEGSSMPSPVENRRAEIVILKVELSKLTTTDQVLTRDLSYAHLTDRKTSPQREMENEGEKVSQNPKLVKSSYAEATGAGEAPVGEGPRGGTTPAKLAPVILTLLDNPYKFSDLSKEKREALIKGLTAWIGPVQDLRVAPRGDLMIFPTSQQQKEELLEMSTVDGIRVKIDLTRAERERRVVIHAVPTELSEDQITEKLAHVGVTKATRWSRLDESGRRAPSGTVCLTIVATNPPEEVKLDLQIFKTKLYIPRPNICFNCWKFDHHALSCQNKRRCRECSGEHEEDTDCDEERKCPTCGDHGHSAGTEKCRVYASRQLTIKMAKENNISIKEAATRLKKPTKNPNTKEREAQDELSELRGEIDALKKEVINLKTRPQAEVDQSHIKELAELKGRVGRLEDETKISTDRMDQIDQGLKTFQDAILKQLAEFRQIVIPKAPVKQASTTVAATIQRPGGITGPPVQIKETPKQTATTGQKDIQLQRETAEKRKSTTPLELVAQHNSPKKPDQRGNTTPGKPAQTTR